jgi:putative transposase
MAIFNPEVHHRRSVRLVGFNYSRPGYYFVTICLNDVRCLLSNYKSLQLTPIGEIAKRYWMEIPRHYPKIELDEFVIMPDHVHGILKICDGNRDCRRGVQFKNETNPNCRGVQLNAPTDGNNPNTPTTTGNNFNTDTVTTPGITVTNPQSEYFSKLSPMGCSLSVIIRNYKSTVKRWCNENGFLIFKWQRSFHDRIIRDEKSLFHIRQYIRNNPAKWLARSENHLIDELETLHPGGEMLA